MSIPKDLKKFLNIIQEEGWTVEKGRKHIKIKSTWGQLFISSSTLSCPNSWKQLQRDIRRYANQPVPERILK